MEVKLSPTSRSKKESTVRIFIFKFCLTRLGLLGHRTADVR